jgi:hypothetical protein
MTIPPFIREAFKQLRAATGGLLQLAVMLPTSARADAVRAHFRRIGHGYILFTLGSDVVLAIVINLLARAAPSDFIGMVLAIWLLRGLFWLSRTLYSALLFFAQGERERMVAFFLRQFELGQCPAPRAADTAPRLYLEEIAADEARSATARVRAVLLLDYLGKVRGQSGIVQQFMAETAFAEALSHHATR